jgi:hypothetical protein
VRGATGTKRVLVIVVQVAASSVYMTLRMLETYIVVAVGNTLQLLASVVHFHSSRDSRTLSMTEGYFQRFRSLSSRC